MTDLLWLTCYLSVVLGLSLFGIHRYLMVFLYYRYKHRDLKPLRSFKTFPLVTVQVPIFNELYVVERLISSIAQIDYPKDKLEIQILDDSIDETRGVAAKKVAELKAAGFHIHHLVRTNRQGFKAGALAEGLAQARGEFLAIFDADFMPTPDILQKPIHFFTDSKIGMIQTRWGHLNRNYSLLTRLQALFLDGHLLIEQTVRHRSGRFFNFNGTAGIWRRSCIESAGGWQHDTLTEDLDLSYRAQLAGWQFHFLPQLVTPAELPVEMNAFKTQQHRWTKGSVQTCKKLLPAMWRSELPFKVKLEATIHLTSNFAYLMMFAMCLLVNPVVAPERMTQLIGQPIVWGPVCLASMVSVLVFYFSTLRELNQRWWRELWLLPLLMAVGIGMSLNNAKAVLEAVFNYRTGFTRTPKYGIATVQDASWRQKKYFALKNYLPFIEMTLAIYFGYFWLQSIFAGSWMNLPILTLFTFGFMYVALFSLLQHLPRGNWLAVSRS